MVRSLLALLPLAAVPLAGCEAPDKLCTSPGCVAKSDPQCPGKTPIVGAKCDVGGVCYFCDAESETRASSYACEAGEWAQVDYGIDAADCEGPADTSTGA